MNTWRGESDGQADEAHDWGRRLLCVRVRILGSHLSKHEDHTVARALEVASSFGEGRLHSDTEGAIIIWLPILVVLVVGHEGDRPVRRPSVSADFSLESG